MTLSQCLLVGFSYLKQASNSIAQDLINADCAVLQHRCLHLVLLCSFSFLPDSFQYLLEAGWAAEGKVIGVTQPRRVAAISVRPLL